MVMVAMAEVRVARPVAMGATGLAQVTVEEVAMVAMATTRPEVEAKLEMAGRADPQAGAVARAETGELVVDQVLKAEMVAKVETGSMMAAVVAMVGRAQKAQLVVTGKTVVIVLVKMETAAMEAMAVMVEMGTAQVTQVAPVDMVAMEERAGQRRATAVSAVALVTVVMAGPGRLRQNRDN